MAHPIFDRITYAWERQEAVDLFEVLTAVFWNSAEIVMLYEQSGGDRADLNIGQAPAHVWHDLLDQLAEEGRLRRFCTDVLPNVRRTQANEKFQAIVQAVIDALRARRPHQRRSEGPARRPCSTATYGAR